MTRAHVRLMGVRDADRVDGDQVRPFAGLALAALLCAVLTAVGAGGLDVRGLVHAGRPIAGAAVTERDAQVGDQASQEAPATAVPQGLGALLPRASAPSDLTSTRTRGTAGVPSRGSGDTGPAVGGRVVGGPSGASWRDVPPRGADVLSPRSEPAPR